MSVFCTTWFKSCGSATDVINYSELINKTSLDIFYNILSQNCFHILPYKIFDNN